MKALILAGGTGTRLWPLSREKKPKQFHSFLGDRTLLQMTYDRLDFLKPQDIFVSTSAPYANEVRRQLPRLPKDHVIVEPESRDTGPAICYAANIFSKKYPSEVMSIIYADHLIANKEEFKKKLLLAEKLARSENTLNIVEVKAQFPNPHLGYVKLGKRDSILSDGSEIYVLDRFVEKPDVETAKKYLASYKYMWNTGIYVWRVSTILEKFKRFAPAVYKNASGSVRNYPKCPKISIDYCVMEKVDPKEVRIIPADLGWSDIGNWSALFDELSPAANANFVHGQHLSIDTEGSVIVSDGKKLIVTSGIKDMVIVDTPDALLVMPKDKAADVKKVVEELRKRKKEKYL